MPALRFAANLSFLFQECPFLDRFASARACGFDAVEFHFPYEHDAATLAEAMLSSGQQIVLFNLPAGNWATGERGIACIPDRRAEFRAGVERAIEYAQALDVPRLNCLAGIPPVVIRRDEAMATLIDNLRHAAPLLAAAGIELLLEPLNTRDTPGVLIATTRDALQIIDAVGAPNLKLQFDIYHAQVMEGDLTHTLRQHCGRIGHIQVADNPGRNEPGSGEIRFEFLFDELQRLGYRGWIGCEYKPRGRSEDSFAWMADRNT